MFRKHSLAILAFVVAFAGIAATDSISGVHNDTQAPTARTGAPGEQNCTSCHSGTVNSGGGTLSLTGLPASGYVPGQTYALTVTVNDVSQPAGTRKYGFSSTVLNSTNKMAGTWAVTNTANTSTGTATVSGSSRSYMRHKAANSSNTWTFNWTAPATDVGTVKFYVSGVAANGTGNDNGDKVYTANFSLDVQAVAPTATFTTSATTLCAGESATFTNTSAAATSYDWDFGNGSTATTAGPHTISYPQAGTYTVTLTASNATGFDTQTVSILVAEKPAPTFAQVPNPNPAPSAAPLLVTAAGAGTYAWYLDDVLLPNTDTDTLLPTTPGMYHVCVTNANGCTGCSEAALVGWTATDPARVPALRLSPNPAREYVRVALPQPADRLDLMDNTGRVVRTLANPVAETEVSLAGLPAGVYLLRASLRNGGMASANVVKE